MKTAGKIWLGIFIAIIIIAVIVVTPIIRGYNKAISLDEATKTAWANVDTTLQRRLDLIPNLVETVKGYAVHEKELFENIAKSREKYFAGDSITGKIEAANEISSFLNRLLMLSEAYPELKANQNFLQLMDSLEGTENRINVARTRYNEAAKEQNQYVRSFFGRIFASFAGVGKVPYFEAAEQAKTEVPKVEFNK